MDIDETKARLRKQMKVARAQLAATVRTQASTAVCRRLTQLPAVDQAATIGAYAASPRELDLAPFFRWARERGVQLALPRLVGPGRMAFHTWEPHTPLEANRFGIGQPPATAPVCSVESLAVVLVPGLAFDASGGRLGMGGGYYDRALANGHEALNVGIGFDLQVIEAVPCAAHDLRMDAVVTELRTLVPATASPAADRRARITR